MAIGLFTGGIRCFRRKELSSRVQRSNTLQILPSYRFILFIKINKAIATNNGSMQMDDLFYQHIDKSVEILNKDIEILMAAFEMVEKERGVNEHAYKQHSMIPFIYLSYKDITVLFKLLFKCEDMNDQNATNLVARTLAIHFYEFIEDVGKMIGKPMRSQIMHLPEKDHLTDRLNVVAQHYQNLKDTYKKSMEQVRVNVSAHKDIDVRKQIAIVKGIDIDAYKFAYLETTVFFLAYKEFIKAFIKAIKELKS